MSLERETISEGEQSRDERIDGVVLISDFMEKYEMIIRPFLKKGDSSTVMPPIMELGMRFAIAEQSGVDYPHPMAYAKLRMAITYLSGLKEAQDKGVEMLSRDKSYFSLIDRQVNELDILMGGVLKERWHKEREKWKNSSKLY